MDLDLFAEYFTTHIHIHALVYDNRSFGSSDGHPRFEIIPSLQMSDLQDAITFAQSLVEVEATKIAIWGSSYSGGNVLQVGAVDRRVKAVLSQTPMISGIETVNRLMGPIKTPIFREIFAAGKAPGTSHMWDITSHLVVREIIPCRRTSISLVSLFV
jgi:hypothetical protein